MIKNYLKVAWRNLLRNKAQSFINIAGLSVGLACSLLILLWVQNEESIDGFHSPQLYTVIGILHSNHTNISGMYDTPGVLSDELKRVVPEIEYATGMGFGETSTFRVGEKILKIQGNSAGADYFKMFSFPLIEGTPQNALNSPSSLAISRKMAEQFFGSAHNAIGKNILYQNAKNFTITAVFENLPKNVSQTFDFLTNWEAFLNNNPWARSMGNVGPQTFVTLRKDANASLVDKKLTYFYDRYFGGINRKTSAFYVDLSLQPYAQSYLHNNVDHGRPDGGRIAYVHIFSIVAIFILLIACINFMNLSTARSLKRAREVGVRKAIGAMRSSLIGQFISESLLTTILAVAIALGIVVVVLPVFNQITQKEIVLPFRQVSFWLQLIGITLITGLLSGSYPALFLSSFKPVKVLKGALKLDPITTLFRKGLVVFQFVLSVILITGTIIISRQMNYIESKNLGYNRENLISVTMEGELRTKYNILKDELQKSADIKSVSRISTEPTDIYGSTAAVGWIGQDTTKSIMFTTVGIGYDFFQTMQMKMVAGRAFSKDYPTDTANYILNEIAVRETGYKDPIGQPLRVFGRPGKIIGVVKDFHFHSMHTQIGPIIFRSGEHEQGPILIRTQPGKSREAVASIERLCKQLNPAFPPSYHFVDEQYQKLYQNEQIINKLSDVFAFLAVFISCLGLLGLAMFTAEQRIKEIGIRKVLGASIRSLFALLSREFVMLVTIALFIATPVTWYVMDKWLHSFQYYAPLNWWVFAIAGVLTILIALATVSFQAIKAALVNPVKSLRSE